MLISFSDEENRFPVSDRLVVGETWISGFGLDITDNDGPEMSAAGSLFPAASALGLPRFAANCAARLFRMMPVSPARSPEPNTPEMLDISETALPSASMAHMYEVSPELPPCARPSGSARAPMRARG